VGVRGFLGHEDRRKGFARARERGLIHTGDLGADCKRKVRLDGFDRNGVKDDRLEVALLRHVAFEIVILGLLEDGVESLDRRLPNGKRRISSQIRQVALDVDIEGARQGVIRLLQVELDRLVRRHLRHPRTQILHELRRSAALHELRSSRTVRVANRHLPLLSHTSPSHAFIFKRPCLLH